MSNYQAIMRSNYFLVKDVDTFTKFIEGCGLEMLTGVPGGSSFVGPVTSVHDLVGFKDENGETGIPTTRYNEEEQDYEEIDFMGELAEHLQEGEVVIATEIGFDKLKYLVGITHAVNSAGEQKTINMADIDDQAKTLGNLRTLAQY